MEVCRHLGCNDSGKCGFAKPWRTSEQQMVCCLTSAPCSFEHNAEVLFEFALTNKITQGARSQPNFIQHLAVVALVLRALMRVYKFFTHVSLPMH
jgi:hypothetical protein